MDKKKLGIVLILLAVIIAAVYLLMHCFYEKKAPEAKKEPAILEQEPDLSEPELNVKNDEEEEKILRSGSRMPIWKSWIWMRTGCGMRLSPGPGKTRIMAWLPEQNSRITVNWIR